VKFNLLTTDKHSRARAGILSTGHGDIPTPVFMPVGTAGSVKGVHVKDMYEQTKAHIMLSNTYHLYLRPGTEVLSAAGGLHRFMGWEKPVLTDSGGYQVFSLSANRKFSTEGVTFRSHIDGSYHLFTPENVVETQRIIGSDIMMALDECTPWPCDKAYASKSLKMTHKWLERGFTHYDKTQPLYGHKQAYFPIVQGSVFDDLRTESARFVCQFPAVGYAIGGLSVGEPVEDMYRITELVTGILPVDRPRYLMGVGTPTNIIESIALGVDMFDCVMPTRNGRNGMLFTSEGIINIRNEKWKNCFDPIDAQGTSWTDTHYSKAYLRHLFISGEMLGPQLASIHNIAFYVHLAGTAREKILSGDFENWKTEILPKLGKRL
jgi:queuine tRNA-ribosyltransferase